MTSEGSDWPDNRAGLGIDLIFYTYVMVCPGYMTAMWLGCLAWKKGGQRAPGVPFKGGE